MSYEIERKYLVNHELWKEVPEHKNQLVHQLYLQADEEKAIRIRIIGQKAFITIKRKISDIKRAEFEYAIPLQEAKEMMKTFSDCPQIEKTRHFIPFEQHLWEVDVFHGKNEGLIVAEIELKHEDELFALPDWVSKEVTHDAQYLNVNLAK